MHKTPPIVNEPRKLDKIKDNYVEEYSEEEYRQLEPVIKAVKAFVRSTHQCVYVIDYAKKEFVYVLENISYLCGRSAQEFAEAISFAANYNLL